MLRNGVLLTANILDAIRNGWRSCESTRDQRGVFLVFFAF